MPEGLMSDAEILAMPNEAPPAPPVEAPAEEAPEETEQPPADTVSEEEAPSTEEAAPEAPKKKPIYVKKDRLDEVSEQRRADREQYQAEIARERAEKEQAKAAAKALEDFIRKASEKPASRAEEIDPVDPETTAMLKGLIEGLEQKVERALGESQAQFENRQFEAALSGIPAEKQQNAIAAMAVEMNAFAAANGLNPTIEQVIAAASEEWKKMQFQVFKNPKGNVQQLTDIWASKYAKAAPAADKTKIDMKQVQKNREQAGAPTYSKESVQVSAHDWQQSAVAEMKEKGFDDKYLRSQGL